MGNHQSIDLALNPDDADSGYSEQNSPFEYNTQRTSYFETLDISLEATSDNNDNLIPVTSTPLRKSTSNKLLLSVTETENSIIESPIEEPVAPLLQRRRSSVIRSKNIEITRRIARSVIDDCNMEDTDNFDCSESLKSRESNVSLLSNSWSPNSNLTKNKLEFFNSKSASEKTTPTKPYPLTNSFISGMNFVGRVAKGVKDFYNEINPATLTGAIDVVVVKQADGSYRCSPFHVRFGKLGVIRSKEKIVDIQINGQLVEDLHMVLGEAGEAFFIERINNSGEVELSTCSEFANCYLPPDTPLTTSVSHNCELSSLVESKLMISPEENTITSNTPNTNSVTLEKTVLNSDVSEISKAQNQSDTIPIPISKSTPLIFSKDDSNSSLSPIISPGTVSSIKEISDANLKPNLNFFSDGDITPELTSPAYSRPSTPRSDTEVEISKFKRQPSGPATSDANQWNWNWGDLPERQNPQQKAPKLAKNENSSNNMFETSVKLKTKEQSSSKLIDNMRSLVSKKAAKNAPDGIYLDDTDKLDSEVADLYLNQKSRSCKSTVSATVPSQLKIPSQVNDDDQESGNGQSLPQSPVNAPLLGNTQLSLCGFKPNTPNLQSLNTSSNSANITTSLTPSDGNSPVGSPPSVSTLANNMQTIPTLESSLQLLPAEIKENPYFDDLFQQHAVSFEKFLAELTTITLNPNLVIRINNRYMNWQTAAPIILSAIVFQKSLPTESINSLIETNMPKTKIIDNDKKSIGGWGSNLFYWGSKKASEAPTTTIAQKTVTTTTTITTTASNENEEYGSVFKEDWSRSVALDFKSETESTLLDKTSTKVNSAGSKESTDCKNYYKHRATTSASVDFNEFTLKKELYRKSTRLSSEVIKKLNLKMGSNEIEYSITTALQGTTRITSYIFLWNYDDKIIVSDIDGTITRSDVWGQVLPIFGRDWSQEGVADLFTAIERNKYKFMYLSARAIGQSKITRDLLNNINQDGFTLPEGPLLVTPTSLFVAFQKEVIERKPEEFKISCLSDIKALFPLGNEVFYAGYGNKSTDVTAYKAVGMPQSRIFTINPQGEVKHEVSRTFQTSYSKLCDYVDLMFPPFLAQPTPPKAEYDSFSYWRNSTIMNIDDEIEMNLPKELKENKAKQKAQSLNSSLNTSSGHVSDGESQLKP